MSGERPTLSGILKLSEDFLSRKGIENARGDARRLLAYGLSITPMQVMLQFDRPVEDSEVVRLRELVVRRSRNEPLQHIEGSVGFRHLVVRCDARALVPRPETELIVDHVLTRLKEAPRPRVHEVGAGTGCISLSLRHERADLRITASDISPDALSLARENAQRLGIWLPLWRADLLCGLKPESLDAIVSNPPYVRSGEIRSLSAEVRADPLLALDGGTDGLDAIRRLVEQAREVLRPGGWLFLEHGHDQGEATRSLCGEDWSELGTEKDLAGSDRFLVVRKA